MKKIVSLAAAVAAVSLTSAKADILADWTFETIASTNNIIGAGLSPAATQSGVLADFGLGTASASHAASASAWSVPAGNGSAHSWSGNNWAIGDYYEFDFSTVGFTGIQISFDQTSSGTGPGVFGLFYSVNGGGYAQIGANYNILANASPNPVWNSTTASSLYTFTPSLVSLGGALDNATTVSFRLIDASTTSAAGGTVGTGGTDRVDNFVVSASPVPEPTTVALGILGGLTCLIALRRRA